MQSSSFLSLVVCGVVTNHKRQTISHQRKGLTVNSRTTNSLPEDHEHRFARSSGWVAGAVLIAVGVILLLQNLHVMTIPLDNWWALFIFIPAIGAFARAWDFYQGAGGHLTERARGSLFGGVILSLVACTFLFGLNWAIFGPVAMMLVGLSVLIGSLARRSAG